MVVLSVGRPALPEPDPEFRLVMFYAGLAMWLANSAFGFVALRLGGVPRWGALALAVGSLLAILGMSHLELSVADEPDDLRTPGPDRYRPERDRLDPARCDDRRWPRVDAGPRCPWQQRASRGSDRAPRAGRSHGGRRRSRRGPRGRRGRTRPGRPRRPPSPRRACSRSCDAIGRTRVRRRPDRRARGRRRADLDRALRDSPNGRAGVVASRSTIRSTVIRPFTTPSL